MVVYTVIMMVVSLLFLGISIMIYGGKTELIHDYHRERVKNSSAYGKAFGKALSIAAASMALSGVISLFGEAAIWYAVTVLLAGLAISVLAITRVQKKYNGGVF